MREQSEATGRTVCAEQPPALVIEGLELFNEKEYFDAHEVLETAWKQESRPIRNLYQGILLVGVGLYHMTCLNYTGATVKLQTGIDLLEQFAPRCQGIELQPLIDSARKQLAALIERGPENIGEFDPTTFPIIVFEQPERT